MAPVFENPGPRPYIRAPAPHDETAAYKRFNGWFSIISMLFFVAAAYGSTWLFSAKLDKASVWLSTALPILEPRIEFLRSVDGYSHLPYTATVISGMISVLVMIIIQAVFYWKTVVRPGKAKGVIPKTFGLMAYLALVFAALVWIAFIFTTNTYDPRWPGMTRVILWPIFPLLGGAMASLTATVLFSILVGIVKLVFMCKGNDGHS